MFQRVLQDKEQEIYQQIVQEGCPEWFAEEYARWLAEGYVEGFKRGYQKGQQQQQRQDFQEIILCLVEVRFSDLVPFATPQVSSINGIETLKDLALKVVHSQDSNEVRRHIIEASNKDKN